MKIDVAGHAAQGRAFPRLMTDTESGAIYLITELSGINATGTLLVPAQDAVINVGVHYSSWNAVDLVDFVGTITLSNG